MPEEKRDKNAAEAALDEIAAACGCSDWDYPGQVVRDVLALKKERDDGRADLVRVAEARNATRESRRALEFELQLLRDKPAEKRLAGALAERDELQRAVDKALVDRSAIESERARLVREVEQLRGERDAALKLAAEGRKAGRAEAAAILMAREAESWSRELLKSSPIGDTGEWGEEWLREKVLKAFEAEGSEMTSELDRLEGAYWERLAERDDAIEQLHQLANEIQALRNERDEANSDKRKAEIEATVASSQVAKMLIAYNEATALMQAWMDRMRLLDKGSVYSAFMVKAFLEQLDATPDAKNYLEHTLTSDGREVVVTLRRRDGKTPAELAAEARAETEALKAQLAALVAEHGDAAKAVEAKDGRLAEAFSALLDAAEQQAAGIQLPAEEWFAVRDFARAAIAEATP